MRIWAKASTITFIIAITIIFFQVVLFITSRALKEDLATPESTIELQEEPQSIKILKDSLFMSTIPKNYSNFALQLSTAYEKLGKYDSAARYKALSNTGFSNERN